MGECVYACLDEVPLREVDTENEDLVRVSYAIFKRLSNL